MPTARLEMPAKQMNIGELNSYLYRTIENLNYLLNNLDSQNIGQGGIQARSIADFDNATVKAFRGEFDKIRAGKMEANYISALVANLAMAAIGRAEIDVAKIKNLTAEVLRAVSGEFETISATKIDAYELMANLGKVIQMEAERVEAGEVETSILISAIAQTADLWAKTANIDMANIKNSFTAESIIQNGVAGEFYMDGLVVNDANLVSLSTGSLMVKGEDGGWYKIIVGEDGVTATREPVVVEDQNVDDNSLSGEKIVEGSMNVGKLSAASLQANEAFLVSLVAGLAKFGALTANEAMVAELTAALIRANDALRIVIEQGPAALEGLNTYFDFTDGLRISAEGSNFSSKWDTQMLGFYQSAKLVAYVSNNTFNADRLRANTSSEVGDWQWASDDSGLTLKWIGG